MSRNDMEKIYFAGPWITEHEVSVVSDMLRNGWYEHPYDYCENFQDEYAAYHDRRFGIMTPSCTTAIHLLLTGLGISENDEVLMPETQVAFDISRIHIAPVGFLHPPHVALRIGTCPIRR